MAVSFSGEGRSCRSHSTSPNVAPAATNTATRATVKNRRHGNAFMVRTAGWNMELAVLLSSRQSGGGVIGNGPFRKRRGHARARQLSCREARLGRDVDQAVGLLAATEHHETI